MTSAASVRPPRRAIVPRDRVLPLLTIVAVLAGVASIALGGVSHALQTQGHGGVLDQADPAPSGGGGLFGSIVSAVQGAMGGGQGGDLQSGLSSLINMFQPGVPVSPGHQQALNDILPK